MGNNQKSFKDKFLIGIQIGITSGCAVFKNGEIIFAASEERYSRIKNDCAFPEKAIKKAISNCQIIPEMIEKAILVTQNMSPIHFLVQRECKFTIEDYIKEQYEYYKPTFLDNKRLDYLEIFKDKLDHRYVDLYNLMKTKKMPPSQIWNKWRIEKVSELLNINKNQVTIENHEHAHASYAYYGSPIRGKDVLIATMDGFGDKANSTISHIDEKSQIEFKDFKNNFNIGRIYRFITLLLGMKPSEHEFKVMGLAPYATEYNYKNAYKIFCDAYKFDSISGDLKIDSQIKDHYFYYKEKLKACRFDGIAGGLQLWTETIICDYIKFWIKKMNKRKVVLSGGVSLNIKANMEISKLSCVDDLFVVGSGGDESLCIGAVYAFLDRIGKGSEIKPLDSLYLGEEIKQRELEESLYILKNSSSKFSVLDYNVEEVSEKLANGMILGRASGKSEFGARALGNRSILADPRNSETIKKINNKIKKRDFWMPFTPSILDTCQDEYLVNEKKLKLPYMSVACDTTNSGKTSLKAALHPGDETARPQIVKKENNPEYYSLLENFKSITGVGALLNTSLNLHGLPIVQNAEDAIHVMKNSEIDGLIINDKLIIREK